MHVIFLGVGLHWLGNVLWIFVLTTNWFGGGTVNQKLRRAWNRMKEWVRGTGQTCSHPRFTKKGLQIFNRFSYPELKGKAHNCKVMLGWIAQELADCLADGLVVPCNLDLLVTAGWALADFVAQLDWHRHPARCSTAYLYKVNVAPSSTQRLCAFHVQPSRPT